MQPSLFDRAPLPITATPYQPSSATSRDAARKAKRFVGQQGEDVLAWLRSRGALGGSQKEASNVLGIGRPSCCARFNALEQAGWIVKTAERRGSCFVYVAA